MRVGLDIGSTTIKCVVLNDAEQIVYSTYERHYSHILEKGKELLHRAAQNYLPDGRAKLSISGSAGMGLADSCKVPFVQEVFATRVAANKLAPGTDCIIELGGEDAKILFLTNGTEVRMNGSCAGGTGAFIDQMATLLKMSADEMDKAAQKSTRTYTIASRCGVFAKSESLCRSTWTRCPPSRSTSTSPPATPPIVWQSCLPLSWSWTRATMSCS